MNISPSFTNTRSYLAFQFSALRRRAIRDSLWAAFRNRSTRLTVFPEEAPKKSPNRRFLGLQDVQINQIVGTINRQNDFDHKFRPLQKYLQDRWVNAYLTLQGEGWSPILVHKVGERYFVEDGHHRVSVAQELGITFIQAKVWEYSPLAKASKECPLDPCPERSSAQVYAGVTE